MMKIDNNKKGIQALSKKLFLSLQMVIDTKNYNWSVYRKQETEMVSPKQNIHIRLSLPRLEDHSLQRKTQEDCESQTWSLKTTKQYPGYRTAVTYENPQMPKYQKKKTSKEKEGWAQSHTLSQGAICNEYKWERENQLSLRV